MRNKLPTSWVEVKFSDLLDIEGGTQPPKSDFIYKPQNGYIRLLQIRDFGSKPIPTYIPISDRLKTCGKDDILIARYGASIGRVLTGMEGAYNVAMVKVIVPNILDRRYVYYLLKSDIFQRPILSNKRSAQDGFNKIDLQKISIPVPPIQEQRRIAQKLDATLSHINEVKIKLEKAPTVIANLKLYIINSASNGTLTEDWRLLNMSKENGRSLLKKIISDRKKQFSEKQANGISGTKLKPLKFNFDLSDIDATFEIPNTWEWTRLINIAEIASGITKGKKLTDKQTIELPYLSVSNVQDGFLDLKEIKRIPASLVDLEKYKLLRGDVLLTEGGDRDKLGRGTVWQNEIENCIHQNHIFRARVNQNYISPVYVSLFTKSTVATKYFFEKANQTVNLASISLASLANVPLALPPYNEQLEIVKRVNQYWSYITSVNNYLIKAVQSVQYIQQLLFIKAFTGKLVQQDILDAPASELVTNFMSDAILLQDNVVEKTIVKKHVNKSNSMKVQPIKDYQGLLACLEKLGGEASPNDLLNATSLEDDIDLFFDLLRYGRDTKHLDVPIGQYGLIRKI